MNRSDHTTSYEEKIEYTKKKIDESIRLASRVSDIRFSTWASPIARQLDTLAKCRVVKGDLERARGDFRSVARWYLELRKMKSDNRFPRLQRNEEAPRFDSFFLEGFPHAILSDDDALLRLLAQTADDTEPIRPGSQFMHHISAAIKYLILGDLTKARNHAVDCHKLKYFRLSHKGYSHAVLGVIEGDMLLVNEGIALRAKSHKASEYGSVFWEFSHEATALAKLAKRAGLHPTIQTPFIPHPMLSGGERTESNVVEQLLDSLSIANERSGKPLWKILRILPSVR